MKQVSSLEKAIEYIENHLNENIGLYEVAKEIGYSYYHMARLFSSVLGESVGHYINRRRLYNASEKLLYSNQRVIDIAFDCGYESPEAFSRAFKTAFGSNPVDYRRAGLDLIANAKRALTPQDVGHIANNISRSPEIVTLKETKVVGLRGTTSVFDNHLPELWGEFLRHYKDLFMAAKAGYGICETQQRTYTKAGDVLFSVMVGSPVDDFDSLPANSPPDRKVLQGGKYAIFQHRGTLANLSTTYQYIYGTWLQTSKEELDEREDFELYIQELASFDDLATRYKSIFPSNEGETTPSALLHVTQSG